MSSNDQYKPEASKFFAAQPGSSTGAPGSDGITAPMSAPPLMSVEVSTPGKSSQIEPAIVSVNVGDTDSMSSDAPVPESGDPLSGLKLADIASLGPWSGSVWPSDSAHVNAASVPSLASQIAASRRPQ